MSADFLMFDYETLSSNPLSAPVISLGAIMGNWEDVSEDKIKELEKNAFYCNIKAKRQVEQYGLKISEDTVRWWSEQGEFAKNMLNAKDKIEVEEHCKQFTDWFVAGGGDQKTMVFVRAPQFDYTIMANVFEKCGFPLPYSTWKVRDVRSIIDAVWLTNTGYIPGFKARLDLLNLVEHFAVHDCIKDLLQLKACRELMCD